MIGTNPDAYVVPYFPSDDFFARIQGNIRPTPTAEARIKKDLRSYSRRLCLLGRPQPSTRTTPRCWPRRRPPWGTYGFTVNTNACVEIPTKIGTVGQSVHACPVLERS